MERPAEYATRGLVACPARRGPGAVAVDESPRLYPPVHRLDALEQRRDQIDGREHRLADRPGRVDGGQLVQAHGAGSA